MMQDVSSSWTTRNNCRFIFDVQVCTGRVEKVMLTEPYFLQLGLCLLPMAVFVLCDSLFQLMEHRFLAFPYSQTQKASFSLFSLYVLNNPALIVGDTAYSPGGSYVTVSLSSLRVSMKSSLRVHWGRVEP